MGREAKIKNKKNNKNKQNNKNNKKNNRKDKENKIIFCEVENILFSYKKYKKLNKNNLYSDLLMKIENSFELIKDCKNYKIIEMRYFKKMTYEEIANEIGIDIRSVYYNRKKLIEKLKMHFKMQGLI